MSELRVAAVDFDHTLVDYDADGRPLPMPGAREAMENLRAEGYWIVIYTCRIGIGRRAGVMDEEVSFVESVLQDFGIPFDEIYLGDKLIADVYIDDRAVSFEGDWSKTASGVRRLRR